jgi:hypothetical protein
MHHKRKRPKNARAGCLLCKPWKVNGFATKRTEGEAITDHVRRHAEDGESRPPRPAKPRRFGLWVARDGHYSWYKSARGRDEAQALLSKRGVSVMPVEG